MMKLEVSGGMITDKELLETWPSCSDMDINDKKIWFARQVIRMAQEVRPLVFERDEYGDLVCRTGCKIYEILNLSEGFGYAGRLYKIEEKAIAAAQDDFTRITLSNLVHGGKNET